jgi:hypothetical protein
MRWYRPLGAEMRRVVALPYEHEEACGPSRYLVATRVQPQAAPRPAEATADQAAEGCGYAGTGG